MACANFRKCIVFLSELCRRFIIETKMLSLEARILMSLSKVAFREFQLAKCVWSKIDHHHLQSLQGSVCFLLQYLHITPAAYSISFYLYFIQIFLVETELSYLSKIDFVFEDAILFIKFTLRV